MRPIERASSLMTAVLVWILLCINTASRFQDDSLLAVGYILVFSLMMSGIAYELLQAQDFSRMPWRTLSVLQSAVSLGLIWAVVPESGPGGFFLAGFLALALHWSLILRIRQKNESDKPESKADITNSQPHTRMRSV